MCRKPSSESLTNGLVYRFYTDLETPNKMDEVPFLELDLENPEGRSLEAVKLFAKSISTRQDSRLSVAN